MISCINRLMEIGPFKFNLALHDNWQFYWSKWLTANKIIEQLEASDKNSPILKGGDIYASRQDLVN